MEGAAIAQIAWRNQIPVFDCSGLYRTRRMTVPIWITRPLKQRLFQHSVNLLLAMAERYEGKEALKSGVFF